jgi:subtilisin family serine protease
MVITIGSRARAANGGAYLALACAAAACGQEAGGEAPSNASAAVRAAPAHTARTITLITGDRVTLTGAPGSIAVHVEHGPGRAQIGFTTLRSGDDVTVIPGDVAQMVASGRIDRALFDVTRLLADGFGDTARDDLPLIVTGAAAAPRVAAMASTAGLMIVRAIPALHAVAIRQRKASPGAALAMFQSVAPAAAANRLMAPSAAAAPGAKLWLDRRRRVSLDRSVPQIGAPAAYARGFTGKGVTIAVLDTGIDASHPDLADVVVEAKTFVDDGLDSSDLVGHGTHVGSIIAGSGAASNGQFRGVAPDARLISARVCQDFFCQDSAILAAMAWAVTEEHAPIINMSLGAGDLPGIDPIEDAVNQLSAQYGALFVVAAGNFGDFGLPGIDSPASAEAALAVGAVDRDDERAAFSSFGPTADGLIKPDVTAPGVVIVAAMANLPPDVPPIGDPVGTAYQALSGTSMATPHVAGAAAILLEQHPGWTGAQLKAQLTSSAKPNPDLVAFEQGTGRIDLDRATRQQVTVQPPSVNFGQAVWPHTDDPVLVRSVTYHNDGAAPVALALTASLAFADHTPAPTGMIRVEPATLTVPAGGSADATVTVDTNGDGPDGAFSGAVVATADDTRVATVVAVEREVESYDLTLRSIDRAGQPGSELVVIAPLHHGTGTLLGLLDGEITGRLPRDGYALYARALNGSATFLAYPRLTLDHNATVEFDERLARPIEVALAGTPLTVQGIAATTVDLANSVEVQNAAFGSSLFTAQVGPEASPDEFQSAAHLFAVRTGSTDDAPEPYNFARRERGHLLTGWRETVRSSQLATIEASHVAAAHSMMRRFLTPVLADLPQFGEVTTGSFLDFPPIAHRTEHVFGAGVLWNTHLAQFEPIRDIPDAFYNAEEIFAARAYRPGQRYVERWHHAPFGPAFANIVGTSPATRQGDMLTLRPSLCSDANVPARAMDVNAPIRSTLFRDGAKFAERFPGLQPFFAPVEVPPGAATYRLETEQSRGPDAFDPNKIIFELSLHVSAAWTFRSQHVPGTAPQILSLPTPRFFPALDDQQSVHGPLLLLPVLIDRPEDAPRLRIASVRVEISFDDGATWSPVPGVPTGEHWLGLVIHPRHAAFASLRATAEDIAGNRGEVSIIRAYQIADR